MGRGSRGPGVWQGAAGPGDQARPRTAGGKRGGSQGSRASGWPRQVVLDTGGPGSRVRRESVPAAFRAGGSAGHRRRGAVAAARGLDAASGEPRGRGGRSGGGGEAWRRVALAASPSVCRARGVALQRQAHRLAPRGGRGGAGAGRGPRRRPGSPQGHLRPLRGWLLGCGALPKPARLRDAGRRGRPPREGREGNRCL